MDGTGDRGPATNFRPSGQMTIALSPSHRRRRASPIASNWTIARAEAAGKYGLEMLSSLRNRENLKSVVMELPRRKFLHLAAGAATLPVMSHRAQAQTYPSRPIRILVGFPAGGTGDIVARLLSQGLQDRLGQPFVVENRPG